MIELLVFMMGITCLFSKGVHMWPLLVFVLPVLLYWIAPIHGEYVYVVGGVADLMVVWMLTLIRSQSKLALRLAVVSFGSLIFNFIGWIMYEMYMEPAIYNQAFILLYALALIVIWSTNGFIGGGRDNFNLHGVHHYRRKANSGAT